MASTNFVENVALFKSVLSSLFGAVKKLGYLSLSVFREKNQTLL